MHKWLICFTLMLTPSLVQAVVPRTGGAGPAARPTPARGPGMGATPARPVPAIAARPPAARPQPRPGIVPTPAPRPNPPVARPTPAPRPQSPQVRPNPGPRPGIIPSQPPLTPTVRPSNPLQPGRPTVRPTPTPLPGGPGIIPSVPGGGTRPPGVGGIVNRPPTAPEVRPTPLPGNRPGAGTTPRPPSGIVDANRPNIINRPNINQPNIINRPNINRPNIVNRPNVNINRPNINRPNININRPNNSGNINSGNQNNIVINRPINNNTINNVTNAVNRPTVINQNWGNQAIAGVGRPGVVIRPGMPYYRPGVVIGGYPSAVVSGVYPPVVGAVVPPVAAVPVYPPTVATYAPMTGYYDHFDEDFRSPFDGLGGCRRSFWAGFGTLASNVLTGLAVASASRPATVVYQNPYQPAPVVVSSAESPPAPPPRELDYSQPIEVPTEKQAASLDEEIVQLGMKTFEKARTEFRNGDYAQAQLNVEQAIRLVPGDTLLHELRALSQFAQKKYQDAAGTIYAVLSAAPGSSWETLQEFYPNAETYQKQLKALEDSIRAGNHEPWRHFLLAYHYMVLNEREAALEEFREAARLNDQDQVSPRLVALLEQALGKTTTSGATQEETDKKSN